MPFKEYRKAILACVGFLAIVLSTALTVEGAMPESALPYVHVTLGVLSTYGVYVVRNAPAPA